MQRLAEARGVKLQRRGADLLGLCPFHEDHEPSLVISPEANLWRCLGACQAGGTVIDWVMRAEAVSFRHAVELLRADLPQLGAGSTKATKRSTVQKLDGPFERSADDEALLRKVVDFYHETLKQSPDAMAYLKARGLSSSEMVERFKLGYANRTLGYRLPQKNRQQGAELRSRLQKLGVLRSSGHEHFNGSLVIPIFDGQGRVTEMYGRKVASSLRKGTPLHLYLPGPHRGVWNVEALSASKQIILCESLIDALTFFCAGYRNVTTSYGVQGFTDEHRQAFREHGTERVLIAYDRDAAGDRAAEKLALELGEAGIECLRVQFPKGMDANEYALKVTPAEKSLGLALRQAPWMTKGKTPRAAAPPNKEAAKEENMSSSEGVVAEPIRSEPPVRPEPIQSPERSDGAISSDELVLHFGDRRWRIRGLSKNTSPEALKVNVLVGREQGFHVDTLEMYSARQRAAFIKQAAEEVGLEERVIKKDLGRVLLLEELMDEQQREAKAADDDAPQMSEAQKQAALELLRDPRLLDRIVEDFERCGVVGERTNKLVGYLAASSRKLDEPLAIVVQSSSAAGKSSLMDAILSLMPPEHRVQYSAMTGQSLFYMGEQDLRHKILAIVEEQGAERASYALKILQSEGQLTIASTGKDPATGRLITHEYRVEGPVMIMLTTTAIDVDEELLNRCIVLTVDEGREQTRAIHARQRASQTLEGVLARQDKQALTRVHQDAQRLLRPVVVVNPFANELTFLDHRTRRSRRHDASSDRER